MSHSDPLYDDYNDFHDGVDADDRTNDYWAGDDDLNNDDRDFEDEEVYKMDGMECGHEDGFEDDEMDSTYDDYYDDSMDGDHDSAMESAGWGTDEGYGYYGDDTPMFDDYYGGE